MLFFGLLVPLWLGITFIVLGFALGVLCLSLRIKKRGVALVLILIAVGAIILGVVLIAASPDSPATSSSVDYSF